MFSDSCGVCLAPERKPLRNVCFVRFFLVWLAQEGCLLGRLRRLFFLTLTSLIRYDNRAADKTPFLIVILLCVWFSPFFDRPLLFLFPPCAPVVPGFQGIAKLPLVPDSACFLNLLCAPPLFQPSKEPQMVERFFCRV